MVEMENPLEKPAPVDPIERVHEFARDLAYGVAQGMWETKLDVFPREVHEGWNTGGGHGDMGAYLATKWDYQQPSVSLLRSFGYVTFLETKNHFHTYLLTEKAFALLEKPAGDVSAFVSYRRKESSVLALLVEARLKLADRAIDVFVDKDIPVGQEWENVLRQKVANARYFICLLGSTALGSSHVCDEIEWALDAGCTVITLTHPGQTLDQIESADDRVVALLTRLKTLQSIPIKSESADDYDAAIRKLLNSMGYSTL